MNKVSISAVLNQMLLDVYLKLLSCISFENIQDDNYVAKNIRDERLRTLDCSGYI